MGTGQPRNSGRRIYVCTTFREFNGDANAVIQQRFLDSLEIQTYTNWELVATTFGEKNVAATLASRSFASRVIAGGTHSSYRYSLTDVVANGIRALEETGGILLWTTADIVFSPTLLETTNAYCTPGVAGLSHPHDAYESIEDYTACNRSYPPALHDGIDFLFLSDDVVFGGGGKEIVERYRFTDWGVFEHFLVGVANACARTRVNLWPVERVAKINNDRMAAREDSEFFAQSLRKNWAVHDQFIADYDQNELHRSLLFCSLCFGPIEPSSFLKHFGEQIWQFFIGGGTEHRVPDEWPTLAREFIESRDVGALPLKPGEPVAVSELADYRGFGLGWAHPDSAGVWTQGVHSSLTLSLDAKSGGRRTLVLTMADACVEPDGVLTVDLALDGTHVDTRTFRQLDPDPVWRVELPSRPSVKVTLSARDPRSPKSLGWNDDDHPLGVRLQTVLVEIAEDSRPDDDSLGMVARLWTKLGFRPRVERSARVD